MFKDKTPETIKAAIMAEIKTDLDKREGSFLNEMISPVAMEIWKCYDSMNALLPIAFVDESSGPYIDSRCAEYGIVRKTGTKASASLSFTGSSGTVIPAGTPFLTPGGLRFSLTADVTLISGSGTGTAEAATVGEKYNVAGGEIKNTVNVIAGLSSFTAAAASGGTDAEVDSALLTRLYARLRTPATSGNAYHYRQWALEADGVGDAKILPLWDGPGSVKVILAGPDKGPVDSSVVDACTLHIGESAPIGAAVTVVSAEKLEITVTAAVTINSTTTKEAVRSALVSKLDTYLNTIAFAGSSLLYNRVAYYLLDIDGVENYSSLLINGGTVDIAIASNQVPVLSGVNVT